MNIVVNVPNGVKCGKSQWPARYTVYPYNLDTRFISIESLSCIQVVVAKVFTPWVLGSEYYISVPNFGVSIPGISSLQENFWIMEHLMRGMPTMDAVTVAAVLLELDDF